MGIHVGRKSYADLSNIAVTINSPAMLGVVVVDTAMVEMDHAILTGPGPSAWSAGLYVVKHAEVMLESTTISGFWSGIQVSGSVVDFFRYPTRGGDQTNRILNDTGPGVAVDGNSTLYVGGGPVVIDGNGVGGLGAFSIGTYSTV